MKPKKRKRPSKHLFLQVGTGLQCGYPRCGRDFQDSVHVPDAVALKPMRKRPDVARTAHQAAYERRTAMTMILDSLRHAEELCGGGHPAGASAERSFWYGWAGALRYALRALRERRLGRLER